MALALLNFIEWNPQSAVFNIDIGTNVWYKFRIGSEKNRVAGLDTVRNITANTVLKKRKREGGDFWDTKEEVRLPKNVFNRTGRYIQLISCKDESGRSPAVSKVIALPVDIQNTGTKFLVSNTSLSMIPQQFNNNRRLSHNQPFLAQQMSLEDILSALLRNVVPSAVGMLGGAAGANGAAMPPATVNAVSSLLHFLLGALGGTPAISHQQSYANNDYGLNRFTDPQGSQFSKQFIFGIDDALLATLAGPLIQQGIQLLPQLINAANQHRLDTLRANNQLMTNLNADVQRRLMLQLLQNAPAAGGSAMNEAQLMQLLQQLQPASAAAPSTTAQPAPATASSLSFAVNPISHSLSNSLLLSFENKIVQKWNGRDTMIYGVGKAARFSLKITVSPAPKTPLPKAIFRIVLKDSSSQQVVFEKFFKQKNIVANSEMNFDVSAEELSHVPQQKPLELFSEMRWLSSSGKEHKAVGSEDAVFVNDYFVKEWSSAAAEEKELTDMNTYRSFWNKVWESGTLTKGERKKLWEINATLRYSVFLSPGHDANGLLETKIQQTKDDADSITVKTYGKMKSGAELSITELNKLLPLWPGENPLDAAKLKAINNIDFAKNNAGDAIYNIRLKGREGVRGIVWAIPTFKLLQMTLNKILKTNEAGLAVECSEEKVKFPVPSGIRILGLKSKN